MAKVIGLFGESGSGKTTSVRNLDSKTTFYFDCDKKGLSWKNWRKQYSYDQKNYVRTDNWQTVWRFLERINGDKEHESEFPNVKTIVIDTVNSLMVADEVRRMKEKGYDKWADLAQCVWEMIDFINTMRDALTVILLFHSQTQKEDDGYTFTRIKTSGKKLDKLCIESKLTTIIWVVHSGDSYKYLINAPNSTCKVPMGAIEVSEMDNDIVPVIKALEEY